MGDQTVTRLSPEMISALLWYWMAERHAIYQRRAAGQPKPWTSDSILRSYRFCNVFRELDTVTVWIRKNVREPFAADPLLWLMLAACRYINHPPTLEELIHGDRSWPDKPDFHPRHMTAVMEARAARGEQVYTGAYMIKPESDPKQPHFGWSKHRYICEIVIGRMWEDRKELAAEIACCWESQEDLVRLITGRRHRYRGWGPFMTYEWTTDLTHTTYLGQAKDRLTWASAGPGAVRGLNRYFGRPVEVSLRQEQAVDEMRHLLRIAPSRLPTDFPALEMRDIEHSLCEYDKYMRVRLGEGRPRSTYPGKA